VPQELLQAWGEPPQPAVVGALAWQAGKQAAQVAVGIAQEVSFGAVAEQDLDDGQAGQLGVADVGVAAWPSPAAEQVIDSDIQCRGEGVEVGAHEGLQQSTMWMQRRLSTSSAHAVTNPPKRHQSSSVPS